MGDLCIRVWEIVNFVSSNEQNVGYSDSLYRLDTNRLNLTQNFLAIIIRATCIKLYCRITDLGIRVHTDHVTFLQASIVAESGASDDIFP